MTLGHTRGGVIHEEGSYARRVYDLGSYTRREGSYARRAYDLGSYTRRGHTRGV